ncbi:hypothetical protein [Cognatilysobacter terrigena]|uniref:hypothetical protein n=1 Tax=Cognatilysobacter terrigena TaxID=2488749 RepID=UPI001060A73E|nr:hypothetical protein [Lysobacter terrigena]
MDRFFRPLSVACLAVVLSACSQTSTSQTDATPQVSSAQPAHGSDPVSGTPRANGAEGKPADALACAEGEELLFGCTIASSGKSVTLCSTARTAAATRYRFGTSSRVELEQVGSTAGTPTFSRTPLMFAGDTGGYAYSFQHEGTTYALYSVSGRDDIARAGIAVINAEGKKVADLKCEPDSLRETESLDMLRATQQWPSDPKVDRASL